MATVKPARTLFQLPDVGTWFENIAVRADGTILATALHAPELWAIDPTTGKGSITATFPTPIRSLTGIAELSPDVFAIGAGQFTFTTGSVAGSWGIWVLDFNAGADAKPRLVTNIPEAALVNGLARLSDKVLLVGDSMLGVIYKVDIDSGAVDVAFDDPMMKVPEGARPTGVNGIKVFKDYLYFANTTRATFFRVPLAGGLVEEVAKGFMQDDFVISEDGIAYIATHGQNTIVKVSLESKEVTTLAGNLESLEVAGGTACAFGRGEAGKGKLYVVTTGGLSAPVKGGLKEPAKVAVVDLS